MTPRFALPPVDFAAGGASGDAVVTRQTLRLTGDACTLVQTLVSISGAPEPQRTGAHQEVLFVISGSGGIIAGGEERALPPRCGVSLPADTEYRMTSSGVMELMRVQVVPHEGSPERTAPFIVHSFEDAASGEATGGRDFQVLLDASVGFGVGTLFVGNVPPGPAAPIHYHQYDEVICILEGSAVVHIEGEQFLVAPGSCYRLPARILHQVENTGAGALREIGFFVPEGTPAGAYLPDGQGAIASIPFDEIGPRAKWTVPQV